MDQWGESGVEDCGAITLSGGCGKRGGSSGLCERSTGSSTVLFGSVSFFFCLSECDREACCVGAVYLRILFIVRHGGRGTLRPVGRRGVEKKRKRKESVSRA